MLQQGIIKSDKKVPVLYPSEEQGTGGRKNTK